MSGYTETHRRVLSAILRQAMDDYIKMSHPKRRTKKYQLEAFWSARDILWRDEYVLKWLKNENNKPMNLYELCCVASNRENVDLKSLRKHLLKETVEYWEKQKLKTIDIPADVSYKGHAYEVRHQPGEYSVDYDNKIICVDKESVAAEEQFMQALMEVCCYHDDVITSVKVRRQIARGLFHLLRMNNCFTGS